jgi:DNA-binding CsgD family transcriptional regulator
MKKKPPYLEASLNVNSPSALEREFKLELSQATHTEDLEQCILKSVNLLGKSAYSLMRLDKVDNHSERGFMVPRLLLCSHRNEHRGSSTALTQAKVASIKNRHLSMLYHFIACAELDTPLLHQRQIQFMLITSARNHEYYISLNGRRFGGTRIISKNGFTKHDPSLGHDKTAIALYHLINAIAQVGCKRFSQLFLRGTGAKRCSVSPQPQRLLNILASQDKSLSQAAEQLGITINTVNKHMATAKSALGTNTIAGTIWAAVIEGLISDD